MNRFVAEHARSLVVGGLSVLHQCGPGRTNEGAGEVVGYRAVEFLEDVPAVLGAAELALARAGASTVAEIGAARLAAVFVPHPASPDRHQHRNAELLGAGARVVDEGELSGELSGEFAQELIRLAGPKGDEERAAMRAVLAGRVSSEGAQKVARGLVELGVSRGSSS